MKRFWALCESCKMFFCKSTQRYFQGRVLCPKCYKLFSGKTEGKKVARVVCIRPASHALKRSKAMQRLVEEESPLARRAIEQQLKRNRVV